jgi:hypothetical protein
MRTFIFIKRYTKNGQIRQYIAGMEQGNTFPTAQNNKDNEFYGCQCIEVTEKCHIELGKAEV